MLDVSGLFQHMKGVIYHTGHTYDLIITPKINVLLRTISPDPDLCDVHGNLDGLACVVKMMRPRPCKNISTPDYFI